MTEQAIILIVDDLPAGRDTLEALLIPEKHRLLLASSGPEAIRAASETTPDLILLDVMMPGMDGFETCRRLRSDPRLFEVPIIMVTALDDRSSRLQGIQAGADDFITKPYDRAELRARVRTITRLNRYRKLLTERSRYEKLIELSPDGVIIIDRTGVIHLANPTVLSMFGVTEEREIVGRNFFNLIGEDDDQSLSSNLADLLEGKFSTFGLETAFLLPAESGKLPVEVHVGLIDWNDETQVQIIVHDITERKKLEERLTYLAMYDSLTGLPNLNLLLDRLDHALAQARRKHELVGLVHLDIDGFHTINETLGRTVGNSILAELARRFSAITRESDTLARISTDEFVIVGNKLEDEEALNCLTNRLIAEARLPISVSEHEIYLNACIGACIFPLDGENSADLLKNATVALSFAKSTGIGTIKRFEPAMKGVAMEHLLRSNQLRKAVDQGEMVLYYQPQIDLVTLQPIGLEALVRWQHPELGLLPPSEFISLAEETGLIHHLGSWIFHEVCQQQLEWQQSGQLPLKIAVNISPIQFEHSMLIEEIIQMIGQYGLDPSLFAIEITENLFLRNQEAVSERLTQLRSAGIRIDLDDFGTAYSSLSYLRKLPVDTLKIDRSFVSDITDVHSEGIDQAAFIKAIVTLGHSLKKGVLAEGVETIEQLALLSHLGCDQIQGFFFSRPIPPAQIGPWIQAHQANIPGVKAAIVANVDALMGNSLVVAEV